MAQSANEGEVIPVAEAETRPSDEDSAKARAQAYNVKGNEKYRHKDFSDAIRLYTEGIEVNCKDDELKAKLYSNRAKAHFRLENFIDSLEDAKRATDLQPSFVKAIISGASACVELKEFEQAVTWCEKGLAIAIDKENPTLLELRNKSVNEQAKSQEKIEEKDASECNTRSMTAETLDSDATDVNLRKIAEVLMNEGNDEFKRRDFGNAVHLYTEGIKVRCKDGELKAKLYSNRSAAYFKLENFSDSLRDAKIATDLQPSFVKTVVRGASACVQLNRFEEAITWCDKGLEIDENNPKLLELRRNCVTEQSRLQQLQGENATEDPPKTHTRNGAFARQSGTGTNDSRMQRSTSGGLTVGSNVPNFKTDVKEQERRLKLAEEAGDKEIEGAASANLGNAYQRLGNFKRAIEYHERDLEIAKGANHLAGQGRAYCNLGNAYYGLGDFKKAISCHTRDLQIAKELGDVRGEGMAYSNLGIAYRCLGYFKKAVDYHERYLEIATKLGDKAAIGKAYGNLGCAYYSLGDLRKAVEYHHWDLQIAKDRGDIVGEGKTYCNLGNDYSRLGDLKKAIDYHKLDLEIAQEIGDVAGEGDAYCNLGNDFNSLGYFRKAIAYHQRHLEVMKAVGNVAGEGAAYNNLGSDYRNLGEYPKAKDYIERYLSIAKNVGDVVGEGKALGNLATVYEYLGDFKKAVVYAERQLQIAKKTGDLQSEGHAYASLGVCYRNLGDFQKAIQYTERQLKIDKNVGAIANEATAYCNLGNVYQCLGDFKTAKRFFDRALDIARQIGDRVLEGQVHGNLGNAHYNVGNVREAIRCHELSLAITKEVGDIASEGKTYGNLGTVYHSLGDFRKAVDYHKRQLEIAKRVGDIATEGVAYGNLGNAYDSLGDFKRAIAYHERDLKIAKEVGDIAGEGVTYGNLGNCYHGLGDFHRAIDYFECHLKLAKEVGDRASEGKAYGSLGSAYDSLGDSVKAIEFHERCRQIATETGDKAVEGIALGNIGQAYHNRGDFAKAIHFLELHLEIAKKMGAVGIEGKAYSSLGVAFFRLRDFQKAIECHKRYLEIAKEVGDEVGIGVSSQNLGETYQALGALSEAVHCYHRSVAVFNGVRRQLEFNDEWKMSLRNLHHSAYVNLWRSLLEQGKITEALVAAEQGRAQALKDLLQLNYASEGNPDDLGPHNETVNDLLDCLPSNTVFMALEKKEVVFWIFQKGKEPQLRRKEIMNYDHDTSTFLESLMKTTWSEINVEGVVKCEDRSLDVQRDGNIADEHSFSEMTMTQTTSQGSQKSALTTLNEIVISPIQGVLLGNEVIFVPEGPLCLAPFAAFMDADSKYLSESFRVRVIPSLTSMKLIADCPKDYHSKTGSLLVGDPWIQEVAYRGVKLPQLPCAQEEVQMIGRILDTAPLIGRQATKDEVLKRLSSVALVHIAAHGKMQTGEIALAPNPNRKSQVPMEEDFLLTMRDVLNVQMRAQLVVLSCCHSAHGEIKAEGVVGVARAFLGAGARSVLVSLWAIDDDATLEFMRVFYRHLLSGKSTSESLNQTMKCMRESNRFNHVKHWAPFVLIGDDVALELCAHN